jgi:flagellar protein FliO/FliZ
MTGLVLFALQAPGATPVDIGADALRAIAALAAVMAALVGFLWLLKRGTFAVGRKNNRQALAVESALSLGDRRSLVIVSVEGRRLLLGLSSGQVGLITELAQTPASFGAALDGAVTQGHPRS